jgi:hypothetical protein
MKGQMIFVAATLVLIIWLVLYSYIEIFELLERGISLETIWFVADEMPQLKGEIENILRINKYAPHEDVVAHIHEFTFFLRKIFLARGKQLSTVSILAYTPQQVISGKNLLNVSVFNQNLDEIEDLRLTFSYDPSNQIIVESIPDASIWNFSFNFSVESDTNFTLTISYKTQRWGIFFYESLAVPIRIGEEYRGLIANVVIA